MAFPVIPTILSFITNIPGILKAIRLISPIKDKILAVDDLVETPEGESTTPKPLSGERKHSLIAEWVKVQILPEISKYGFDEYDMDTVIRFIVLFVRKVKRLRQFKKYR